MSRIEVQLDQVVTAALKKTSPLTFRELEAAVRSSGESQATALEVRQSAWRMIGSSRADLTQDMKVVAKANDD
jgi:hypothetical protein